MQVWFLGREDPLEADLATHSSILSWRIPWTEEPGELQSTGLHRVEYNWNDLAHTDNHMCEPLSSELHSAGSVNTSGMKSRCPGPHVLLKKMEVLSFCLLRSSCVFSAESFGSSLPFADFFHVCVCLAAQSCPTLAIPVDLSPRYG